MINKLRLEKIAFVISSFSIFPVSSIYLLSLGKIGAMRFIASIFLFFVTALLMINIFDEFYDLIFYNIEHVFWISLVSSILSSQQNLMFLDDSLSNIGKGIVKFKIIALLFLFFYLYTSLIAIWFLFYCGIKDVEVSINQFPQFFEINILKILTLVTIYLLGFYFYMRDYLRLRDQRSR